MAVLVRKKNKKWYVMINLNGKRKSKAIGPDKATAEAVAKKIREKLSLGAFGIETESPPKIFFDKYCWKWLACVEKTLTGSTWSRYDTVLRNHLIPEFKGQELSAITKAGVRDFILKKLDDGHSRAGISLMKVVLSSVFSFAIEEEILTVDPSQGVTRRLNLRANDKAIDETKAFNESEIELLLETCQRHFRKHYLFFLMACRTGMRLGELLGAKWSNVDFNSGFMWVREQYRRGRFNLPKGGKIGKVEMSDQLREALLKVKKVVPLKGECDLIFNDEGKPWGEEQVRKAFKSILKKAGLRELKFHSLRHS